MLQQTEKEGSNLPDASTATVSRSLSDLISQNESWLMSRILNYAKDRGYTKYTSTLFEAWRLSISGISSSLMAWLAEPGRDVELGPEEDFVGDPAAAFGILEARTSPRAWGESGDVSGSHEVLSTRLTRIW